VIAAMFMAGTVVRPLRTLRRSTERVASGDLSPPPPLTEGPPEVRQLAAAFTAMTARIAALLEQQRTFAGDASHQLRTPLTALRLQIERAGDLVRGDPAAALERLEAAALETERMQRMVEGLLLLARNERVHPIAVDVAAIVRERADVWQPLAEERGVRLDLRTPDHLAAMSTTDVVQQIVDNYIDNALNIAPNGTVVEIVVTRHDEWVEVHVLDRGPGMPDDHLTHAFDRFWRAPTAEHDGSGLGLAIVHHLAERTGSTVALANRLGGGIDASVRMPFAGQQQS
jgi:signal transduction histidine kinase